MMLSHIQKLGVNTMMLTRHSSLEEARQMARSSMHVVRMVVMGDDNRYWVVTAKEAAKLRKAGYETV